VNGPLARKGQLYTFVRYAPPRTVNGQLADPVEILNNGQPWTMVASIQPITGMKTLILPEGFKTRSGCTVYTETKLNLADSDKKTLGDHFQWNGYWFEVTFRLDWTGRNLNHYAYQAFKTATK
jgi:hypothetical protein